MLMALIPIEESGETRLRTDCFNFDVSPCIQIKKQISFEEENIGITFFVEF